MINIEIKGVQFSNKGAELMLVAVLQQLDKHLDEYQITLSPGVNLPYEKRAKLGAWQKLSFRRGNLDLTGLFGKLPGVIKRFLKRFGIVTEADIDVILDTSGFSYGDQWPKRDLKNAVKEMKRFQGGRKLYIVLPQALGPFDRADIRAEAEQFVNSAHLIFPRDEKSYKACLAFSKNNNLQQSPDFTASVICPVSPQSLDNVVCLVPNNKMVSRYHNDEAHQKESIYIDFWCYIIEFFSKKGFKVVLLNHEGKEDLSLCHKIQSQSSINTELLDGLSALEVKGYLGQCHAVISSRFHGCISALSQGVPCLALAGVINMRLYIMSMVYQKIF
ncbi:hypothetical protein PCIT_a1694 [Pseudoalteromonas citrea]|uniref:Polysaccharide pyruvyl transferase domain-containing protein n=2 Tax=Pseudoalteromonas citrea TaxID=43655 RepID=A0AAD4AMK7_9GAMM|nr:polysaccharide pyruvyl transferase family protein [Pseudoalteromonas citrea]KAF7775492.1 hypothetical protein PCIT_a1694 [Pseudoalteromonas citrea]